MTAPQILNPIRQNPGKYGGISYTADGKLVGASLAASLGTAVQILNAGTLEVLSSNQTTFNGSASLLAFSPDSAWVAVGIRGERFTHVEIRDANTLKTLRSGFGVFGIENTFNGFVASDFAFSSNGLSMLSSTIYQFDALNPSLPGQHGGQITVFDAAMGSAQWHDNEEYEGKITPPAISSPTGQQVAYATPVHNGVLVVDAMTGIPVFIGPSGVTIATPAAVTALAFSPDGRWLIAGCVDSSVHVFDTVVGASANAKWPITLPGGGTDGVTSVAVSGDSKWVATINANFFGIYALPDGTARFSPPVQLNLAGRQLIYSPTLRHVIATLPENPSAPTPVPLAVIDAFTGAVVATSSEPVSSAALAPDGISIACVTDDSLVLLDLGAVLAAGVELAHYPNPANPIPYAADTALSWVAVAPAEAPPLVAVADTSPGVRVINAQTGALVAGPKPVRGIINAVVFASQGQAVVTAASSGLYLSSIVDAGSQGWSQDAIGAVKALALVAAADGERLAVAVDKTAQLRTVATGDTVWSNTHPQTVTRIAASADGKHVATGCQDGITRILDAAGATAFTSPAGAGRVTAVAFAPTTTLLASANEDGTVLLVNAADPTQSGQLRRNFPCRLLAFSADAALLAVADDNNTVTVYDVTDLAAPTPLPFPLSVTAPITALAFNPADASLASATDDTAVTVYDPRTGIDMQRIVHPQPVRQFAFNTTGTYLATICDDQITRTWRMVFE